MEGVFGSSPSYWMISVFYLFAGQGVWGIYLTALSTNMKNLNPLHRGKVICGAAWWRVVACGGE